MITAATVETVTLAAFGVAALAVVGLIWVASSAVRALTRPATAPLAPSEPKPAELRSWEPPPSLPDHPPVLVAPIAPPPPPPATDGDQPEARASVGQLTNPLAAPVFDPADIDLKRLNRFIPEGPHHEQ